MVALVVVSPDAFRSRLMRYFPAAATLMSPRERTSYAALWNSGKAMVAAVAVVGVAS